MAIDPLSIVIAAGALPLKELVARVDVSVGIQRLASLISRGILQLEAPGAQTVQATLPSARAREEEIANFILESSRSPAGDQVEVSPTPRAWRSSELR